MQENKKLFITVGIALLIVIGIVFWGLKQPEKSNAPAPVSNDEIIYYYGEECSHCKDVTKFLEDNKIAEKVNFSKKEVWNNSQNSAEMQARVKECGIDSSKVGVPFLYARGKCLIGTPDVTDFFKNEAGIQ